jgi:hypothetical protein
MKKVAEMLGLLAALGMGVGCGPRPTPVAHSAVPLAAAVQRSVGSSTGSAAVNHMVYYLPSRVLDLLDVVSVAAGGPSIPYLFPASAHVNVHATRAFQVGAGGTKGLFLGWGYGRQFAWTFTHHEMSLGPLTVCDLKYAVGQATAEVDRVGMLFPTDPPFDGGRMDYWALGAHAGLLAAAVDVDVHPGELLDALLGFFFIDLSNDDLGGDGHQHPVAPTPTLPPASGTTLPPAPAPR